MLGSRFAANVTLAKPCLLFVLFLKLCLAVNAAGAAEIEPLRVALVLPRQQFKLYRHLRSWILNNGGRLQAAGGAALLISEVELAELRPTFWAKYDALLLIVYSDQLPINAQLVQLLSEPHPAHSIMLWVIEPQSASSPLGYPHTAAEHYWRLNLNLKGMAIDAISSFSSQKVLEKVFQLQVSQFLLNLSQLYVRHK